MQLSHYCYLAIMLKPKSELLRQEVRKLLENLLDYDKRHDPQTRSQFKIITNWNQNRFRVRTKLKNLLSAEIYEPMPTTFTYSSSKSQKQQIDRLRYLFKNILEEKLRLLEDNRPDNGRGQPEWRFTLKLKHSPEELNYIEHNLRAFDRHWHKIYGTQPPEQFVINNLLSRQHTQFFGYQRQLDRLLELLSPKSRVQTICIDGMSGSGKTTLAKEVAYYCLDASKDNTHSLYFDALIFISAQNTHVVGNKVVPKLLAAEQRIEDIVRAIAEKLDFPLEPALDFSRQLQLLIKYLSHKLVLLVIDNLETVEDRDAVANLISHFPETVKVIVTSRVPFAQPNSCSITLTHLEPEAGAELIEDLAKKQRRILSPKQIDSIYKQTGGLPLAITYLVAQIVTTGVPNEEIPKVLNKTPDELLQFCFADLVKSLASTPAYPYLLITALFTQFASVKAIAFINQTTEQITSDNLQHLANLHLLFRQKTEQYSLHSLTQEYLQLELERQPVYQTEVRDRQVQWYLQLVEPHSYLPANEWHDYQQLETEWINLRSVVEWCIKCDRYLDVKSFWQGLKGFTTTLGYWRERKVWLDWLIGKAVEKQDWQMVAEAKLHFSQTLARIDRRDASGEAMKLAQQAWNLKRYCSTDWQIDLSLYIVALYIRQQKPNSWQTAQEWCDRSRQLFGSLPDTAPTYSEKQSQLAYYQGEIYTQCRNLEKALNTYQTALEIAKSNNHKRGIAYIRSRISIILIQQNELDKARQELLLLLELTKQYRDRRSEAFCYQYLAIVAEKQKKLEEVRHYVTMARESFNNLGMETEATEIEKLLQGI